MQSADFLLRICAEPDAVGPRLIYADWLDEQGDPRGEFIRLQCAVADLPHDAPERPELRVRGDELLAQHRAEWLAPLAAIIGEPVERQATRGFGTVFRRFLPDPLERLLSIGISKVFPNWSVRWRRGFPERLTLEVDLFAENADAVVEAVPIVELNLFDDESGERVAALPRLARIRRLTFRGVSFQEADLERLFDRLGSGTVRSLGFSLGLFPAAGVGVLARAPVSQHLSELSLSAIAGGIDVEDLATLLDRHALRRLGLTSAGISVDMVQRIADSPGSDRLESLDLTDNHLGNAVVAACTSGAFPALMALNLSHCYMSDVGAGLLADNDLLRQLHELDLGHNSIGDRGALALADSPHLIGATRLDLTGNPISEDVRQALVTRLAERVVVDP